MIQTIDQVLTVVIWNFIKNKVNPFFPNVKIRRKAMQRLLSSCYPRSIFIVWLPVFDSLVIYLEHAPIETGVDLILQRRFFIALCCHYVTNSKNESFWQLDFCF